MCFVQKMLSFSQKEESLLNVFMLVIPIERCEVWVKSRFWEKLSTLSTSQVMDIYIRVCVCMSIFWGFNGVS